LEEEKMKTRAIFTVLAMLLLLSLYGCLETGLGDGTGADNGDPALGDVNNSGCKDGTAKEAKHNGNGWDEEDTDAEYNGVIKAQVGDGSVTIMHLDAVYQCEAEIIYMLEASGSNLILTEVDSSETQTYCTCSFDLSVDILNLTNGRTYHAEVWNADKTIMFGEVDFTPGDCSQYDECVTDEDCWKIMEEEGMAWPDCEGNFTCIEGACEWQCIDWPTECYSDSDCPYGYYCAFEYYGEPVEEKCWIDENGEEVCEPGMPDQGYGTCQPVQTWECRSDYDCPEGYFCNLMYPAEGEEGYKDCWINEDGTEECSDGTMPPAYGYCEPRSYECYSDSDCPEGYFCNYAVWAEDDTKPEDCWTNPDGSEECGGEIPPGGYGYCEPIQTGECWSDADCPEGYTCVMYPGECWTDPETGETRCEDVSYGYCEMIQMYCYSDYDCPDGYYCAWLDGAANGEDCWVDDAGNTNCEGYYGYCLPRENQECWSADDCYAIYGEPNIECEGARWTCDYGYCGQSCGGGEYQCNSDYDCPEGAVCVYYEECNDPSTGECWGGSYCEYQEEPVYCYSDEECPQGFFCALMDCAPDSSGEDCGVPYGICVRQSEGECNMDSDCYEIYGDPTIECVDAYWACINGYCNQECGGQLECGADMDCPAGTFCSDGVCIGGVPCSANNDCASNEVCVNGVCEATSTGEPCGENGECAPGEVCDWCPPDPNCPMCDVCGEPVCVRGL